jgi:hypothetical protein
MHHERAERDEADDNSGKSSDQVNQNIATTIKKRT